MNICVVNVLKKRNNAVGNLVEGILSGFNNLGVETTIIKYSQEWPDGKRRLEVSDIPPDSDLILIPYWISGGIWAINLAEIRDAHPSIPIISYTGTSPFWHGSTPTYVPGTRSIDASDLDPTLHKNFEVIDGFAVVKARPGVTPLCQTEVGMGLQKEIKCGPKATAPTVVLDFMKHGWDEASYDDAILCLEGARRRLPNMRLYLLNPPQHAQSKLVVPGTMVVPHEHLPFTEICRIWSSAWAFICHNESFGYPITENLASGNYVYTSAWSEIPEWHQSNIGRLEELIEDMWKITAMSQIDRERHFAERARSYIALNPEFNSWDNAAHGILSLAGLLH